MAWLRFNISVRSRGNAGSWGDAPHDLEGELAVRLVLVAELVEDAVVRRLGVVLVDALPLGRGHDLGHGLAEEQQPLGR